MTIAELIKELQEYPPDLKVIGYHHDNYAGEVLLSEMKVRIDGERLEYFSDGFDAPEDAADCLMIDFKN